MTLTLPLVICLTLVFPLIALVLAGPISERAEPRAATWLLTSAALALAGSSGAALALVALAAVIRLPFVAALGRWSPAVIERGDPTGIAAAVVCGFLLSVALTAVARYALRRGRALADAFQHADDLPGRRQIVVTDDASADAYAVPGWPGWPGRIVVSAGMLDSLSDEGRAALLAHERAHLAGRHYAFTSAARLAAAANPLLRPVADAVEYTVERWADECAAQAVGDRRLVAETIARAAVAAKRSKPRRSPTAALGAAFDLASARLATRLAARLISPGALPRTASPYAAFFRSVFSRRVSSRAALFHNVFSRHVTSPDITSLRVTSPDATPLAASPDMAPRRAALPPADARSLSAAGPVPRRVAALLAPPPGRRLILQAAVIAVVLLAGLSAADAAHHLHELIETAEYEPH